MNEKEIKIPEDVAAEAADAIFELLSAKSIERYKKEFRAFDVWRNQKNVYGINEDIMLAYFHNLEKTFKPSLLWTKYSMLKATLNVYEHVDISSYLKGKGGAFKPKKASILERQYIERFLADAPDEKYLLLKIILIFGISGACRCRCDKLSKLKVQDIEDKASYVTVRLPDTKTNKARKFVLINEGFGVNVLDLYKKYRSLRPKNVTHDRFIVSYRKLKCTIQPVGINTIAKVSKEVAIFLNLPNPLQYTGHSLRRSSATLLVNAEADIMDLKRQGGWKSSTVAESYVEESVTNKIGIAKRIMGITSIITEDYSATIASGSSKGAGRGSGSSTSTFVHDVIQEVNEVTVPNSVMKTALNEAINFQPFRGITFQTVNFNVYYDGKNIK